MAGFSICERYTTFWIYQDMPWQSSECIFHSTYTGILNMAGSEYARVTQGSKYAAIWRSSHWRSFVRKVVLRNFAKFTGKHLYQGLFFNKETGTNVLQWICEISKKFFFAEHLPATACEFDWIYLNETWICLNMSQFTTIEFWLCIIKCIARSDSTS